ncbi:hypothetical protein [Bacillus sp. JJ722]|uniref:hypothetical protein n=1 Tax=Bacillus sp. JJ722 TaxID=3122973 RepID=UPI002FFFC93E
MLLIVLYLCRQQFIALNDAYYMLSSIDGGDFMYDQRHYGFEQPPFENCPTQQSTDIHPTQISPTRHIINKRTIVHVVPHFHPPLVNNGHMYQNQPYFSQPQSAVDNYYPENIIPFQQPLLTPKPFMHRRRRRF